MKDYRTLSRMQIEDWEDDIDWKARRLDFIFDVMTNRQDLYHELDLVGEKYDFYQINDSNVGALANKYHYSSNYEIYKNIYKSDYIKMAKDYKELEEMRLNNFLEFVKKCNSNKHDFLSNYFECFSEEYYDLKRDLY